MDFTRDNNMMWHKIYFFPSNFCTKTNTVCVVFIGFSRPVHHLKGKIVRFQNVTTGIWIYSEFVRNSGFCGCYPGIFSKPGFFGLFMKLVLDSMLLLFRIGNACDNRSTESRERDENVNRVFQEAMTCDLFAPAQIKTDFAHIWHILPTWAYV